MTCVSSAPQSVLTVVCMSVCVCVALVRSGRWCLPGWTPTQTTTRLCVVCVSSPSSMFQTVSFSVEWSTDCVDRTPFIADLSPPELIDTVYTSSVSSLTLHRTTAPAVDDVASKWVSKSISYMKCHKAPSSLGFSWQSVDDAWNSLPDSLKDMICNTVPLFLESHFIVSCYYHIECVRGCCTLLTYFTLRFRPHSVRVSLGV